MKFSKIPDSQIKKLIESFCSGKTTRETRQNCGLNRHTIDRHFEVFRQEAAKFQEERLQGILKMWDIDLSYLGSRNLADYPVRFSASPLRIVDVILIRGAMFAHPVFNVNINPPFKFKTKTFAEPRNSLTSIQAMFVCYRIDLALGAESARLGNRKIRAFRDLFVAIKRRHNGIARTKLFLYLKETEFRKNHGTGAMISILCKRVGV